VALWLVIDPCVNFVDVRIVIFRYIFLIPQFLRHQTMDKVQKYNSFNIKSVNERSYFFETRCP
jgi:hypothetical protein